MGNYSRYFSVSEKASQALSRFVLRRQVPILWLYWSSWSSGLLAPVPLFFHNAVSGSFFSILAATLLCINILSFYLIRDISRTLETKPRQRTKWIFKPIGVFFIYGMVLCGTVYAEYSYRFFRYYNLFSLSCLLGSIVLIYSYLKWTHHPMRISYFAKCLEQFGKENEAMAPKNYITFTFGLLKPDLIALVVLVLSIINYYALYIVYTLASIGLLAFTLYSLILMILSRQFSRKPHAKA